ncbi:MAG TPA: hypothetical protein VK171_02920 [Fimbriimonas sp.]|nr:hypothetical protein [Fimbriimonas sp.]
MSFLPALQAVLGVVGAVNQSNSGRAMARRGQAYLDEAVTGSRNAYADALRQYQNRKASGAYNPEALMKLLGDRAAHDLGVQDKNTAASLANLGYRRGDSPFSQQSRQLSERAGFQLRSDLMNAQNSTMAREDNDRMRVNSYLQNLNQLLGGQGQNMVQSGNAMSAGAFGALGGLIGNGELENLFYSPRRPGPSSGGSGSDAATSSTGTPQVSAAMSPALAQEFARQLSQLRWH